MDSAADVVDARNAAAALGKPGTSPMGVVAESAGTTAEVVLGCA
ncbi:hypothetical protein [Nocardia sp. NPDC004123]